MPRPRNAAVGQQQVEPPGRQGLPELPSLGNLLTARPAGLNEPECWAVLCQAVQALQDLFLSDGASSGSCIPLVTPTSVLLSGRGRVRFEPHPQRTQTATGPPPHLTGYLAPEYRPGRRATDTEAEKMWIYGLGETLKRATLTSHAAAARLSSELCQVLADMTRPQTAGRASLMHLLDVISDYCKRREQSRPFSHICMDLHQEAMAALEMVLDTPWGPPAMPELRSLTRNSSDLTSTNTTHQVHSIPRRWKNLRSPNKQRLTREASTSMEDLGMSASGPISLSPPASMHNNLGITSNMGFHLPGKAMRPKSMCIPEGIQLENFESLPASFTQSEFNLHRLPGGNAISGEKGFRPMTSGGTTGIQRYGSDNNKNGRPNRARRNPVHRAASRLYRAGSDSSPNSPQSPILTNLRECVGPEFVVRASLPSKMFTLPDIKGSVRKTVTVILLNGQKLDILCNPQTTTAGQLFELVIQKEHIEENFMLGLSALIAGDFVFLPSDTRVCKAMQGNAAGSSLTLFMRVRFFLPSLRGIRGTQAKHLMYLQLRRSILEHQLPCSFTQLVDLDGLALQAEFGDYNEREHGGQDYFLLEHYVPETMSAVVDDRNHLKRELIRSHKFKMGLDCDKAEEDFIIAAQNLPHYGGHFYTASWVLKDHTHKDVWLYISAQGINLYERASTTNQCGPMLCERFEWKTIQTLCYSKQYLCILPHSIKMHTSKLKKYKLKMDHKKSYFTFRLASLHHQFFLRLRTEFTSLTSLSAQFGIPLKDMKNETNSLYKLEALTNRYRQLDAASVNAETEFRIEFRASSASSHEIPSDNKWRRCRSVADFGTVDQGDDADGLDNLEAFQNKENEQPGKQHRGLILDSSCLSGMSGLSGINFGDKRRGVKMGTRAFSNVLPVGQRVSRSMEAVNVLGTDELEQLSLQSVSIPCSEASMSSPTQESKPEAYVLDCSASSKTNEHQFLPNFQESLSETLQEKLNNFSFVDERVLKSVQIKKDIRGSLGMQITEGSDGKVYVQSVILGGPAHLAGNINAGDQIVAVDGKSLLSLSYTSALSLLKTTGSSVEFILSQMSTHQPPMTGSANPTRKIESKCKMDLSDINESHLKSMRLERTMNKLKRISLQQSENVEKHLTESCYDISNLHKYSNTNLNTHSGPNSHVPYHKHIRYEIEAEIQSPLSPKPFQNLHQFQATPLNKARSKSCMEINNRAVIVDAIPKPNIFEVLESDMPPAIALPRSLGLSRKWRGPVKYPVTPVKKDLVLEDNIENTLSNFSNSDDEQVFI